LESHRHRAGLVGENLGTVPAQVNTALSRHGIQKMYVVQYEARPHRTRPLRPVRSGSVASLNTHDMPPFAAYLRGMDFDDRVQLGLLPRRKVRGERDVRLRIRRALAGFFHRAGFMAVASDNEGALTRAAMSWLAASPASMTLVNLEDLWLETELQNLPGTSEERPNWTRKARYSLEQLQTNASVVDVLRSLGVFRSGGKARR
jgi:4-alpha-glucanotransferase